MEEIKKETMQRRARQLRREMTPQERHLWYNFLSEYPVRFRRQRAVGNFILDFYCHQARLAVELDGSQHFEPKDAEYDRKRSEYLRGMGIYVIRYDNRQVNEEFRAVCEHIDQIVQDRLRKVR